MTRSSVARLTSALLVKKGNAVPASYGLPVQSLSSFLRRTRSESPPLEVVPSARLEPPRPVEVAKPKPVLRRKPMQRDSRARLSMRLEADAYLRLKLVAAHRRSTLQRVMLDALEHYLATVAPTVPEGRCRCLEGGGSCADVPPGGCTKL